MEVESGDEVREAMMDPAGNFDLDETRPHAEERLDVLVAGPSLPRAPHLLLVKIQEISQQVEELESQILENEEGRHDQKEHEDRVSHLGWKRE